MYKAEKRKCTMSTFWNLYKAEKENVRALLSFKLRILKHIIKLKKFFFFEFQKCKRRVFNKVVL